ncbi:MAG: hypothetical protein ACK5MA_11185 [Parachlamydiaceae bacterium]
MSMILSKPRAKASTKKVGPAKNESAASSEPKTKLSIKYDCGYPNTLTIRGEGGNLSWDKGIPLKNIKSNEWVFETDTVFNKCQFKILINDEIYETGANRIMVHGTQSHYTPKF